MTNEVKEKKPRTVNPFQKAASNLAKLRSERDRSYQRLEKWRTELAEAEKSHAGIVKAYEFALKTFQEKE